MKWIDAFRLEGRLPEDVEKAYRLRFLKDDVRLTTISMVLLILLQVAFICGDYFWLGSTGTFFTLFSLRFVFLLYSIGLVIFINRKVSPAVYDWNILFWLICGVALITVVYSMRPSDYVTYNSIDIVLLLIVYVGIPNRAVFRFTVGLTAALSMIIAIILSGYQITQETVNAAVIAMVLVNIVGIFASGRIYTLRRREYAATLEGEKARQELEKLASIDSLTDIFNRRVFMDYAEQEFQRFKRYGRPFCFLVFDIDNFKVVNDLYGHLTGDRVLKKLAESVNGCIRRSDIFGRIGGDEFGILLIETGIETAKATAERILADCSVADVTADYGEKVTFTVCIGLGESRKEDGGMDALFARTDAALYKAKQKGGNCVNMAV